MASSMAGWLWFRPFLPPGMQAFAKQVSDYSKSHFDVTVRPDSVDLSFSTALYDSIMLYVHGANKVMSEGGDLSDSEAVAAAVRNASFTGVAGTLVELDSSGDMILNYEVMSYVVDARRVMSSVAVGIFNSAQGQYQAYMQLLVWPGETNKVPADYFAGDF